MLPHQPIDPALRAFLDEQAALSPTPARTPSEARARMEKQLEGRTILGLPSTVKTEEHWIADESGGLRVRVYIPPGHKPMPVLVYLHGGGWVAGSIETHDPFCRLLVSLAGVSIVSVDYRRAPESGYPAALDDAHRAFLWAAASAARWGGDATRLGLGGDSAGANLAAVLANRLAIEHDAPRFHALLLLYPVIDHPNAAHPSYAENAINYGLTAEAMHWYWQQYAAHVSPDDPGISPLRASQIPPLPPTLVATAQYDVLRDEGIAYARKLAEAGTAVEHMHAPDMHHDFPVSSGTVARFPQCDRALGQIAAWLRGTFSAVRA